MLEHKKEPRHKYTLFLNYIVDFLIKSQYDRLACLEMYPVFCMMFESSNKGNNYNLSFVAFLSVISFLFVAFLFVVSSVSIDDNAAIVATLFSWKHNYAKCISITGCNSLIDLWHNLSLDGPRKVSPPSPTSTYNKLTWKHISIFKYLRIWFTNCQCPMSFIRKRTLTYNS